MSLLSFVLAADYSAPSRSVVSEWTACFVTRKRGYYSFGCVMFSNIRIVS